MRSVGILNDRRMRWLAAGFAAVMTILVLSGGTLAAQADDKGALQGSDIALSLTEPSTFQIHVKGADIRDVLRMLSEESRKNIVATRDIEGTVTADLYNVTFDEALGVVLEQAGFAYRQKGNVIFIYTQERLQEILQAERKFVSRSFRLAYITATDAEALIAPSLSPAGVIAISPSANIGISTSKTDAGGNAYAANDVLIVTDYEENIDVIEQILADLDVMPQQVLIEATILRATLTEDNALGIDFNLMTGVDFSDLGASTTDLTDLIFGGADIADLPDSGYRQTTKTDFSSAVPAGGLSIGIINDDFSFILRALESITDVTVLANPKLTIINKQRGEVMIGRRDGYLTTTVTDTVATQTVEFLETGTRLIVRPFIARDGFIRLEIHPEDSTGSVSVVGTSVLPSESTTEVTSNILVKDGHTVIIGGLFRERTSAGRSQVPLLGNIPYIGTLWRNTIDSTQREEVIILVTPHILKQANDEAVSAQLRDDVERFRMGLRKGLRWWGRNRLSQTHMRWAREAVNVGDNGTALWNLDMALSLEPKMIQAIRLKEKLTEQAYWADEYRWSAVKYVIPRMMMQELGRPVDMVIPPDRPRSITALPGDVIDRFGLKAEPGEPETIEPSQGYLQELQSLEDEVVPQDTTETQADPEDLADLVEVAEEPVVDEAVAEEQIDSAETVQTESTTELDAEDVVDPTQQQPAETTPEPVEDVTEPAIVEPEASQIIPAEVDESRPQFGDDDLDQIGTEAKTSPESDESEANAGADEDSDESA